MKKNIITFLILGLTLSSFSQTDCNCEQALNQVKDRNNKMEVMAKVMANRTKKVQQV